MHIKLFLISLFFINTISCVHIEQRPQCQSAKDNLVTNSLQLHFLDAMIIADVMNEIAKYDPKHISFIPTSKNSIEIRSDYNDWLKIKALILELDAQYAPIDIHIFPN